MIHRRSFFARDVDVAARALLGQHLVKDGIVLRVTECEAYGPESDSAAHCRAGRTARTAPMFGPAGHAYVYLCYGVHWMLNLVTAREGIPQAILVRSCDVVAGLDAVVERRGATPRTPRQRSALVAGPGKVAQALALDGTYNFHDVCAPGGLSVERARRAKSARVLVGPRVGVDYATARDRTALRRYALVDDAVTHRASLR